MAKVLKVEIKETMSELRSQIRKSTSYFVRSTSIPMIALRIKMLVQLKKHNGSLLRTSYKVQVSRRKLAAKVGVDEKSIQSWRKIYIEGGLSSLILHDKKGRESKIPRTSYTVQVFGDKERKFIEEILSNPKNGVQGYKELQLIMNKHFKKEFKYITIVKFCERHFGTKILVLRTKYTVKVARQSHIKKDENAVSDFKKKTLIINSKRSQKK
jgi:transposase